MHGIFTYIDYKNRPNVGEYTSPMDPTGLGTEMLSTLLVAISQTIPL